MTMDTETRELLEREFERHSAAHYGTARLRDYAALPAGRDPALWQTLCDHGWTALGLDERHGGLGATVRDALPLFAAAGRAAWREPLLERCGSAAGALLAIDDPECEVLLGDLVAGRAEVCFAHREAASGFAGDSVPTLAVDARGRLSGQKCCIVDYAPDATLLVTARSAAGTSVHLVAPGAPGLATHAYRTVDGRRACDLVFGAVAARALGPAGAVIEGAQRRTQLFAAAEIAGVMRGAVETTREHLTTRKQFGRPLAAQQVLAHRLVDMHMAALETTALVAATANACDAGAGDLDRRLLSLRAQSAEASRFVTQQAIQLHGGLGICSEILVGHLYRRVLAIDSLCGTADWALSRLAAAS
ncbi:MAG: pimeloyl-CoA dehydrogenase small subunit [Gammaproteobacteria bacterium]|nr:pimeloyl-CoA dehydrogenase small subunit [Gammaproteobacteria bacterium]